MTNSSQPPDLNWRDSFQVKSFRYQWPADLATSWAFEMETILFGLVHLVDLWFRFDAGCLWLIAVFRFFAFACVWCGV